MIQPSHEVINGLLCQTGNQRASNAFVTWRATAEELLQPTTAVWRSFDVDAVAATQWDAAAALWLVRVYDRWAAARRRDAPAAHAGTEGHAVEVGDVDPHPRHTRMCLGWRRRRQGTLTIYSITLRYVRTRVP
eukprot:COSAG06_NODE_13252_length_1278_cov_1.010178_2_plen_133_part_00